MDVIGNLALGIFLGYMAWYFVTRVSDKPIDSFAAVAGVLFGGVVLAFLGGTTSDSRWWYPVGLVVGWIIYVVLRYAAGQGIPTLTGPRDDRGQGGGTKAGPS